MVLTFQVPIFSFICLSGVPVDGLLVGKFSPLSSIHPEEQADRGGTVPYWLGAAQLEAGGNGTMRCDDLSHRRRRPVASISLRQLRWTYNP